MGVEKPLSPRDREFREVELRAYNEELRKLKGGENTVLSREIHVASLGNCFIGVTRMGMANMPFALSFGVMPESQGVKGLAESGQFGRVDVYMDGTGRIQSVGKPGGNISYESDVSFIQEHLGEAIRKEAGRASDPQVAKALNDFLKASPRMRTDLSGLK